MLSLFKVLRDCQQLIIFSIFSSITCSSYSISSRYCASSILLRSILSFSRKKYLFSIFTLSYRVTIQCSTLFTFSFSKEIIGGSSSRWLLFLIQYTSFYILLVVATLYTFSLNLVVLVQLITFFLYTIAAYISFSVSLCLCIT